MKKSLDGTASRILNRERRQIIGQKIISKNVSLNFVIFEVFHENDDNNNNYYYYYYYYNNSNN